MPRTVPHRELRNDSGRILREAQTGETIAVTNRGEVVALLVPPPPILATRCVFGLPGRQAGSARCPARPAGCPAAKCSMSFARIDDRLPAYVGCSEVVGRGTRVVRPEPCFLTRDETCEVPHLEGPV